MARARCSLGPEPPVVRNWKDTITLMNRVTVALLICLQVNKLVRFMIQFAAYRVVNGKVGCIRLRDRTAQILIPHGFIECLQLCNQSWRVEQDRAVSIQPQAVSYGQASFVMSPEFDRQVL